MFSGTYSQKVLARARDQESDRGVCKQTVLLQREVALTPLELLESLLSTHFLN